MKKRSMIYKTILSCGAVVAMGTVANAGTITGQLVCEDYDNEQISYDRVASLISIPGTSWLSTVDKNGYFNITGVVLGTHTLEVVKSPEWTINIGEVTVGRYLTNLGIVNICEMEPVSKE